MTKKFICFNVYSISQVFLTKVFFSALWKKMSETYQVELSSTFQVKTFSYKFKRSYLIYPRSQASLIEWNLTSSIFFIHNKKMVNKHHVECLFKVVYKLLENNMYVLRHIYDTSYNNSSYQKSFLVHSRLGCVSSTKWLKTFIDSCFQTNFKSKWLFWHMWIKFCNT